jgi:putative chitinase
MNVTGITSVIPQSVMVQVPSVFDKYEINTPLRLSHFLAQCHHESMGFKAVRENLNYSAEALMRVFTRYFKDEGRARAYARQPEKIGNLVYGSRMGNGPESSGDGYRYRGRGYIQLTGKSNYAAFSKVVPEDVVEIPELVATKYPLLSAGWFWDSRKLNAVADRGPGSDIVEQVTLVVNGGRHGLADRIAQFNRIYGILNTNNPNNR